MSVRILQGHVLSMLAQLELESVHTTVTSPPYYGLRDYGIEPQVWSDGWIGSLGLEPTLDLYLHHMVEVMAAVHRVLRSDGTCWLNIGDSFSGGGRTSFNADKKHIGRGGSFRVNAGFKPKDLMLVPHRLAIRLQEWGWYIRSDIIYSKAAPMPESCTDRPTSAHEHVFLLTKSAKYYYDRVAVAEDAVSDCPAGNKKGFVGRQGGAEFHIKSGGAGNPVAWSDVGGKRNMRNVWHLGPSVFPDGHFATFNPEIPRRAILAGTSERGCCPKCGAPWVRITRRIDKGWDGSKYGYRLGHRLSQGGGAATSTLGSSNGKLTGDVETLGWRPSCKCDAGDPVPATMLDCFAGAFTTSLVAEQLQRDSIAIELSPTYVAMGRKRLQEDAPLFYREAAECLIEQNFKR